MNRRRLVITAGAIAGVIAALLLALWLGRAWLAAEAARRYFASHGVTSSVTIGDVGLSGISGRFALGPANAPEVAARRIELHFDPLSWLPRVVEVRLVDPVIRARIDSQGRITLPALQGWIDSLGQGRSRFVADDLAVSLTGLRALLATPAGAVEIDGDLKLVKNLPVSASLRAAPAAIAWRDATVGLRAATLDFADGRLRAHFDGDVRHPAVQVQALKADLDASGVRLTQKNLAAAAAHLTATASSLTAGQTLSAPKLDVTFGNAAADWAGGLNARADVSGTASARLDPKLASSLRAHDTSLARAVAANLGRLNLAFALHAQRRNGQGSVTLTQPLLLTGAAGAVLRATSTAPQAWSVSLSGKGLPAATMQLNGVIWNDTGVAADAALAARFDYAMLRGAVLNAKGPVAWRDSRLVFTPTACAHFSAAQFTPLARAARGELCPANGKPLLIAGAGGWTFHAAARAAAASLPLPHAELTQGAALLDFSAGTGAMGGRIAVSGARLSDAAAPARYQPLLGTGAITLAGDMWRGSLKLRDAQDNLIGETSFTHNMARGAGSAHLSASRLAFAPGKLQPENLSHLLAALRRAEGVARFEGDVGWSKSGMTSKGRLTIDSLDFMTPLGKAHAVKTDIVFTSLLPPVTAPNQAIAIDRIDWTIPIASIAVRFALGDGALRVASADMAFAQGQVALEGVTIPLSEPRNMQGTIWFSGVALQSLIGASNLADKIKTEGTISGAIPFTVTADGFHIHDGHIAADHPGRLSISRSVWAQGTAAISTNAVQGFAYQALENLAFETMTADLKSVAGGRLQTVFHLKGKSDPPKPQVAEVALADILNGTALYKPILLPSSTPIDLTLDTSLNFDELLKSYAQAWSKSLAPEGDKQ